MHLLHQPPQTGSSEEKRICEKVINGQRIHSEEGVFLFANSDLDLLKYLANFVRERKHGQKTFFNRNFHLEPTNLCIYDCKFCSYSRELKSADESWFMSEDEIIAAVEKYRDQPVTEVHIVGGVHPKMDIKFFGRAIQRIKSTFPGLHVKAFTAVELFYMFKLAKMSVREGLSYLKGCGLDSLPGGGAEIFAEDIRAQICQDKCTAQEWLIIHETAHQLGIPSNCTMLYSHIETFDHRIDHMQRLRDLQDRTKGFNTFIPLKFRNKNNQMSDVNEGTREDDLRNYAVSRIFFDNIEHIKAYWPMIGRSLAQESLAYGVDDLDGTIDDSTKIYTMAGAEEQHPSLSTDQLVELIRQAGRCPIERDTLYRTIKDYGSEQLS